MNVRIIVSLRSGFVVDAKKLAAPQYTVGTTDKNLIEKQTERKQGTERRNEKRGRTERKRERERKKERKKEHNEKQSKDIIRYIQIQRKCDRKRIKR